MNIAVIGAGYWGPNVIRNFHKTHKANLKYVCDVSNKNLEKMKNILKDSSIKFTKDYNEILCDKIINAISICTPANTHYNLAKKALENNKHVLIEKPITETSEQANLLTNLAQKMNLVLMVGHIFIYNPAVRKLKELISNNYLGYIRHIYSTRTSLGPRVRSDVNVVWDYLIHDVYIVQYLLNSKPVDIKPSGGCYLQNSIEDMVFVDMTFKKNVFVNLNASWYDPLKKRIMVVIGSEKMAIYDEMNTSEKLKIYNCGYRPIEGKDKYGNKDLELYDDGVEIISLPNEEVLMIEIEHFIDCINNHSVPITDGHAGQAVIEMLEIINKKLKNTT